MSFSRRIFVVLTAALLACDPPRENVTPTPTEAEFEAPALSNAPELAAPSLREASGLVASRANAGLLWSHNDSGDGPRLFLLGPDGKQRAEYTVDGARNYDWEDIAATTLNGKPTLFIGDIGDNTSIRQTGEIYRCPEPTFGGGASGVASGVEKILFRYPDGAHDAETLLVDHQSGDLYVLTKIADRAGVYRLPYPQSTTGILTAEKLGEVALSYLTAGDISPDNTEVILKNYTQIFYWKRQPGESLLTTLSRAPRSLPYLAEPAGEGLAFAADASGYFTISETIEGIKTRLFFYRRK
jgi:hypothetical protein